MAEASDDATHRADATRQPDATHLADAAGQPDATRQPDAHRAEAITPTFAVMPGERISIARGSPQTGIDRGRPDTVVRPSHQVPIEAPVDPHVAVGHASLTNGAAAPATNGSAGHDGGSCTSAQLRRFIKSRPYVPMHELRRRFELNGGADDVTAVQTPGGLVYLGLPGRESRFIADLVRQGDVGLELCHDPRVPMVMGVFAIRPLTRQ